MPRLPLLTVTAAALLSAHPMGNFSVSHYARFEPKANSVDVVYVLDLAELPTFDLLRQWGLERSSPPSQLEAKTVAQAKDWAQHLDVRFDGRPAKLRFESARYAIADGAGDLPIIRVTSRLRVETRPGKLEYEDRNFEDRAGWKEIVIRAGPGAILAKASQTAEDRTQGLTAYPQDPTIAPPQDVRASFEWTAAAPVLAEKPKPVAPPVIAPVQQPAAPAAVAPATMTPQAAPAGTVVRGDYLSRLLHQRELSLGMILIAIAAAFGLGAAHALTPGHGKTIVAAYLVGSRGTLKHAAFLGAMVTFTHTVSVFLLGLATLFLFQYVMPERITQVLGVVSGLSIVAIGGWMLWSRLRGAAGLGTRHEHFHEDAPAVAAGIGHTHEDAQIAAPVGTAHAHERFHVAAQPETGHMHGHTHPPDHEHGHIHTHQHGLDHEPGHAHDHLHGHTHGHDHEYDPAHTQHGLSHEPDHAHDHTHDHGHTHDHDHGDTHEHDPAHTHQHGHTHGHAHEHDPAHTHQHGLSHEPGHAHDHPHDHTRDHGDTHDRDHAHTHAHGHGHTHEPGHTHDHSHPHGHAHGMLVHSHGSGGHVHSHAVPDRITWGSLMALAVSGGLVPCESALVLLLSAIALGRVGLGLMMLIAFSVGLAIVLMAIGMLVIYAKHLLPASEKPRHPAFRWIPVASAAVVTLVGVVMTLVSLGWVQARWMI